MDEYLEKLRGGALKLYALEQELPAAEAVAIRRAYIEAETGTALPTLGAFTISPDRVTRRNCENMIGAVQVPVGVAGPLRVRGEHADGTYWLPLATTEGALVASVNRGCSAITRAGGAEVRIFADRMTRAPVFATRSVAHSAEVVRWVEAHHRRAPDGGRRDHAPRPARRRDLLGRRDLGLRPARVHDRGRDGHEHGHDRLRGRERP